MSQAAVNTMPSSSQTAAMDASSDVVSLRNFVVDEDRANLGSDLWKTIDKSSFILAQREALEAYNMAKAIRLSEQTASSERRVTKPAFGPVASSSNGTGSLQAPPSKNQDAGAQYATASSSRARRPSQSQAVSIPRKDAPQPPSSNDEVAARSLARSWQVDGIQTSLLENRGRPAQPTSSTTSRPKTSAGSASQAPSTSIYAPQTQPNSPFQEKRPSISKTPTSQIVSLSTLSSSPNSHQTQSQVNVVPSSSSNSHHNTGHHTRSQSHSVSHSHSRTPSQMQGPAQPQPQRADPRPILKRDPATLDGTLSSTSPPASSRPNPTRSSSASASADPNQQKRRKASISVSPASNPASVSSQVHYPYSTSNYSYYHPYNPSNGNTNTTTSSTISSPGNGTSQASVQAQAQIQAQPVVAPAMSESKKQSSSSSASSKEIQSGQMINPLNAGSSSISAPPSRPSSKETSPQVYMSALPPSGTSSASAQAAAAERENQRSRSSSRRRDSVVQLSGTAPVQPPVQVSVQAPIQAQTTQPSPPGPTQQHAQGPRDIFAPTRFSCSKCGNTVHSVSHAQPAQALTAPDPFSHPFASYLHLTCANSSCGTTHCRGCLKAVKCRESVNENEAGALVLFSTSPSKHLPKPTPASCGGGPGCSLWTCCQNVKSIAVWEALRAFDAVFAAEAGFAVGGTDAKDFQHQALGRQHREAYVKLLISKADKSMRKFEDALVRTLRVVCSWLQPSCASLDEDDDEEDEDEDDEGEDDEDEDEDDADQRRRSERDAHEKQFVSLFRSSYLLEVFHAFLSNNKPRDWIAHSETYIAILEMMRRMLDSGLGAVLSESPTFSLPGSPASAPASAIYTPFATPSGSTSSSASSSPSSSQQQLPISLYDLIKQLEKHRSPLMNLASRMQFSATVDKVNNLCDAISYLLLQQMVG